jgi:UMF1 family MFS transporter
VTAGPGARPERPAGALAVASWALYDLANTIFSTNIVTLYFSLWVVNVMKQSETVYAVTASLSMLLVFVTAPVLGSLSDQSGRRKPFLFASTAGCVAATAFLGVGGLVPSLAVFVVANYLFQAGLVFYDSLLPVVSTPANRGRVGGLGIGVGYLGSLIGAGAGLVLLERIGHVGMFRLTALLFLLFAIPCFLFVREPASGAPVRIDRHALAQAFARLTHTIPAVRKHRSLARFLVGRFFYTDPANTIILLLSVYITQEVYRGSVESEGEALALRLVLVSIIAAVLGGLAWGVVADKAGPRRTLLVVIASWIVALGGVVWAAFPSAPTWLIWFAAGLAGASLGGLWASDRPLMLRLAPLEQIGEFYGLYAMVGRFAAIVGPLLWSLIVSGLGLPRPAAVVSLMAMMVVALLFIRGVDEDDHVAPI